MFGFDEAKEKRDEVYEGGHESHLSHEVIAGGAAFEAMKKWEDSQRNSGEVVNHGFAKELLAGFAAAEVDKLAETRGMDFVDKERAKHSAKKQAEHLYDQQYSEYDHYDPNQSRRHPTMDY
ncbi:Fc.00g009500.m01.CDS01 [Cosmosporella sp. VM-42]